ncbi:MAG TPA: hypothetical protein VLL75_15765 [Vicinamibacteria bacterium]|nr:hypothetical protein [Vicinamibacteria bacterium]
MTRHVPDGSLLDLAEGRGSEADRAHAGACAACASRLAEVRSALDLARGADVPEPSPLYWDALRRSVARRIGEEPRTGPRWGWLGPLAAAALVAAVVLTTGRTHAPSPTPASGLPAWSALPEPEDDPSLAVLEGLAAGDDALGALDEGGGVGRFLASLSDEDYQALAESLRGAGKGGES